MKTGIEDGKIVLFLEGKLNSANAAGVEAEIRDALEGCPDAEPILDFDRLNYISSAGLRVLMRLSEGRPQPLGVRNVSPEVYGILEMTGFTSIVRAKRKLREIRVDGCEIIGRGAFGTVYRIDADTIVKVYDSPDALPMIENEQKRAKQAFLRGVSTAISYDVVRVGARYGSVFEMVKASTCNDLIISQPGQAEVLIRKLAGIIRRLHGVEVERGELPDARKTFIQYLSEIAEALPEATAARLKHLLEAMPEDLHMIHGDIHMKNVMICDDEPVLIDMDTLSTGNPVFDFAGLFVAYEAFNEDDPSNSLEFMGIPLETSLHIWRRTLEYYLDLPDSDALQAAVDKVRTVGYLRFLYLLIVKRNGGEALREARVRHAAERLAELLPRVGRLDI